MLLIIMKTRKRKFKMLFKNRKDRILNSTPTKLVDQVDTVQTFLRSQKVFMHFSCEKFLLNNMLLHLKQERNIYNVYILNLIAYPYFS